VKAIPLPQRLVARLMLAVSAVLVATMAAVIVLTVFFADRLLSASPDQDLRAVAEEAEARILAGASPASVARDFATASQFVQVLGPGGVIVARSANLGSSSLPPLGRFDERPRDRFQTVSFRKSELRVIRHPLTDGEGSAPTGYIEVAVVEPPAEPLARLALLLAAATLVAGVVGLGGSWRLIQHEAAPFRALATEVRDRAASGFVEPLPREGAGPQEAQELRSALSTLIDAQRALIDREHAFFADSSHVLRTPLAVLQACIESLRSGGPSVDREATVAQADEAISTMTRTIAGLLLLARGPERERDAWEAVELAPLLASLVEAMRAACPSLKLTFNAADDLPVAGVPAQLRDLLASIIENACYYTPAGGSVDIGAHDDGNGFAVVDVRDTGIGMTADERAHAFERFYRGARARAVYGRGTGLGLAIAARIAADHGGEIAIMPKDPPGTHVRIRLPLIG
jgi:two-component system OmpR family sensor kinase